MSKVQSHVMLVSALWEKNKRTTKYDKSTVTCDVSTALCETSIIKCEEQNNNGTTECD